MASMGSYIWMLSNEVMALLKRIRRYGLVAQSVSLGMDFEVLKAQARSSGLVFLMPSNLNIKVSAAFCAYMLSCSLS